jgi:hypothetical protein
MSVPKLRADFNGLFGDVLCISHSDVCVDQEGERLFTQFFTMLMR